ncbi:hypothetical protein ACFLQW_00930 [Candidatus Zixiibacteriota bacterium]
MKKLASICTIVIVMTTLASVVAFADDVPPPPWPRGVAGTTFQEWDFLGAPPPPPPPAVADPGWFNPNGPPTYSNLNGATGTWWQAGDAPRLGVWRIDINDGPGLQFNIPNVVDTTKVKDVQIQVTHMFGPPAIAIPGFVRIATATIANRLGDGWDYTVETWRNNDECPSPVLINVAPPNQSNPVLYVDQVVIDTRCRCAIKASPAMSDWGMIFLFALIVTGGVWFIIRQRRRMAAA